MPTIRNCWRTGWMFSRRSIARSIERLALRAQLSWHHVESGRLHRYGLGRRSEMDRSDAIAEVALSQLALAGAHSGAVLSPPSLAAHGEGLCRRRERGCDGCDRWRSVRVGHSGFDGRRNRFCRRRNLRRALEGEDLGALVDLWGGG